MLRNALKYVFVLTLTVTAFSAAAFAESTQTAYDPCTGASGYKAISKVKPPSAPAPTALKVKPWGLSSRFDALSRYNPVNWWSNCCLPMPAKGQFVVAPRVFFPRLNGEARRGTDITGIQTAVVNFDDHLGFKKSGNAVWSINALYQIRPRWGIRYPFHRCHWRPQIPRSPLSVSLVRHLRPGTRSIPSGSESNTGPALSSR